MKCDCISVSVKSCVCFRQVLKICYNHQDAHTPPAPREEISVQCAYNNVYLILVLALLKAADKLSDDRGMETLLQTVSMKALKFT